MIRAVALTMSITVFTPAAAQDRFQLLTFNGMSSSGSAPYQTVGVKAYVGDKIDGRAFYCPLNLVYTNSTRIWGGTATCVQIPVSTPNNTNYPIGMYSSPAVFSKQNGSSPDLIYIGVNPQTGDISLCASLNSPLQLGCVSAKLP
jgi:hypothetical protein